MAIVYNLANGCSILLRSKISQIANSHIDNLIYPIPETKFHAKSMERLKNLFDLELLSRKFKNRREIS